MISGEGLLGMRCPNEKEESLSYEICNLFSCSGSHCRGCYSKSVPGTLSVGQPWAEAIEVAENAGYELGDASHLQMVPTPHGFYLSLANDQGLIVNHNREDNLIESISLWNKWSQGKHRKWDSLPDRFDLPVTDSR